MGNEHALERWLALRERDRAADAVRNIPSTGTPDRIEDFPFACNRFDESVAQLSVFLKKLD